MRLKGNLYKTEGLGLHSMGHKEWNDHMCFKEATEWLMEQRMEQNYQSGSYFQKLKFKRMNWKSYKSEETKAKASESWRGVKRTKMNQSLMRWKECYLNLIG